MPRGHPAEATLDLIARNFVYSEFLLTRLIAVLYYDIGSSSGGQEFSSSTEKAGAGRSEDWGAEHLSERGDSRQPSRSKHVQVQPHHWSSDPASRVSDHSWTVSSAINTSFIASRERLNSVNLIFFKKFGKRWQLHNCGAFRINYHQTIIQHQLWKKRIQVTWFRFFLVIAKIPYFNQHTFLFLGE